MFFVLILALCIVNVRSIKSSILGFGFVSQSLIMGRNNVVDLTTSLMMLVCALQFIDLEDWI